MGGYPLTSWQIKIGDQNIGALKLGLHKVGMKKNLAFPKWIYQRLDDSLS